MWARLIGFDIQNLRDPRFGEYTDQPTATFRIDAMQAELIWRALRAAESAPPLDAVEFEIVVKKTAEAIGD